MKRIIVSGAGGFLGSHIIKNVLKQTNFPVIAITSQNMTMSRVTTINTDEFIMNGAEFCVEDVFINCLFPTNADGYQMAAGLDKVYHMIYKAHQCGVGAFVNISSQSVYASQRNSPAAETDNPCLETPYAVGKYSAEAYTNHVFSDRPHTNIRIASLLGVGYDQRIVNRMVMQALKGEPLKVFGGMQRYGFLDVRDAAAGLVKLSQSDPEQWQNIYNLGKNDSCSLIDVVQCIINETEKLTGQRVSYTVLDGLDNRNSAVNASRFMYDFCWKAEYSLAQTTEHIINSKLDKAE